MSFNFLGLVLRWVRNCEGQVWPEGPKEMKNWSMWPCLGSHGQLESREAANMSHTFFSTCTAT